MTRPMRSGRQLLAALAAASLLAALPALTSAHVALVTSTPQAGDTLETAPAEVTLTFDGELDPAASSFVVHDAAATEVGSGEVDLAVADRNVLSGSVDITEPGVYTVEYAVLGLDGHEITGSFSFGYATDEEIPEGEGEGGHGHDNPDTAMAGFGVPVTTLAGALLVLAAGVIAARRQRLV